MTNGEMLRVRAAMKPISTVPRALATVDVAHRRGRQGAPPALRRLRGAGRRRRRRGDGRAGAGRRGAARSSAATPSPRPAATSRPTSRRSRTSWRPMSAGAAACVGAGRPARRRASPRSARLLAERARRGVRATPTPTSRPRRASRSPTSSSTTASRTSARWRREAVARGAGRARRRAVARRRRGPGDADPGSCWPGTPWSSWTWRWPTRCTRVGLDAARPLLLGNPRARWRD